MQGMYNVYTYHVQNGQHIEENGVDSQLCAAQDTRDDCSNLKRPPLKTDHEHTRQTQS